MIADINKATRYHGQTSRSSKKRKANTDDVNHGRIKKVRFAEPEAEHETVSR